jgi:hypothetical protein
MLATSAHAETAGPPAPAKLKTTAAQVAITNYKRDFGAVPLPHPCERAKGDEVVVCGIGGRGGSADRLPLPDDRGPPDHARTELNESPPGNAERVRTGSCGTQDQGEHCVGGISPIAVILAGVQIARALVDPEGASDAADAAMPKPWELGRPPQR